MIFFFYFASTLLILHNKTTLIGIVLNIEIISESYLILMHAKKFQSTKNTESCESCLCVCVCVCVWMRGYCLLENAHISVFLVLLFAEISENKENKCRM
jgi:hypothetical protein